MSSGAVPVNAESNIFNPMPTLVSPLKNCFAFLPWSTYSDTVEYIYMFSKQGCPVINTMVFLSSNVLVTFLLTLFVSSSSYSVSAIPTLSTRDSRTYPPNGAIVVKPSGAASGEFTSIQAAVNSLPNNMSPAVIFIYAGRAHRYRVFITQPMKWNSGIYYEQVTVSRSSVTVCVLPEYHTRSTCIPVDVDLRRNH